MENAGLRLLVQAGYVQTLGGGLGQLPLAVRLLTRLTGAILNRMVSSKRQSIDLPVMDDPLTGLPIRLTVSDRFLKQGGMEIKLRRGGESRIVGEDQVLAEVRALSAGFG